MGDEGMEKYGVELDKEKVKEAQKKDTDGCGEHCPICGTPIKHGTGCCPIHGTEPFEKRSR